MSAETKACTKCGEVKPLEAFHRDKRNKDGLMGRCRDCNRDRMRQRRQDQTKLELDYDSRRRWLARGGREVHRQASQRWHAEQGSEYHTAAAHRRRARALAGGSYSTADWTRLVNRFQGRCAYCHERPDVLHVEHVVPLSRGGTNTIGNLLPACRSCNLSKGAKLLVEWRAAREREVENVA